MDRTQLGKQQSTLALISLWSQVQIQLLILGIMYILQVTHGENIKMTHSHKLSVKLAEFIRRTYLDFST